MRVTVLALSVGVLFLALPASSSANDADDIIEETLRKAIVKIDVSSNTAVIRNNENVCVSEGTGFVLTSHHVVTSQHVHQLDPGCGKPIIIVKARAYGVQRLATVIPKMMFPCWK